jgi:hypothetical protein
MACPACGGVERQLLAPGFWRCTSSIRVENTTWVPDGLGGRRPLVEASLRVCGHEYQETDAVAVAAGLPVCACHTFAIGVCAKCGVAVCGAHSRLAGGSRRCLDHAAAYDEEASRRAERERQEAAASSALTFELGRDYNRQWVRGFVAAMRSAGSPGSVDLGNGARGWPYGKTSNHREVASNKSGWDEWSTQSAISVDGQLGECRCSSVDGRRKPLLRKRIYSTSDFMRYWHSVWLDFAPYSGISDSDYLRIWLRAIAVEHNVDFTEPVPPAGLPLRPEPGIGTVTNYDYTDGFGTWICYDDTRWGTVSTRGELIDPDSRPLHKGERVTFNFWLRGGDPSAKNVRRVSH